MIVKKDLVARASELTGMNRDSVQKAFDTVVGIIKEECIRGESVRISGFGTFAVREMGAHKGRNPRTGEPIVIPPHKVPKFTPSDAFRKACGD